MTRTMVGMRVIFVVVNMCVAFLGSMREVVPAEPLPAFVDPKSAGPDILVQGGYVGFVGGSYRLAAQVIALGNGKFEGGLYPGGLPGARWDESIPFFFRGETRDGATQCVGIHAERLMFDNPNFEGSIADGIFRGKAAMFLGRIRGSTFEMKKVERKSPTLGLKAPPGALVMFDGSGVEEWADGKLIDGNWLDNGATSKRMFGDCDFRFHVEFRTPFMPTAAGMQRGNSGVYIKKIWEIQIFDSFSWDNHNRKFERLADFGRCGGMQEMIEPRINKCLPPLSWQTKMPMTRDARTQAPPHSLFRSAND